MDAITTALKRAAFVAGAAAFAVLGVSAVDSHRDVAAVSVDHADSGRETKFPTFSERDVPSMELGATTSTTTPVFALPTAMVAPIKAHAK
jgi:hypothetical protein